MSKIRKSAKGQECQVRIQGVCCFDSETTVLSHINGAGVSKKQHDIHAAYCCAACHRAIDSLPGFGRQMNSWQMEKTIAFYEGVFRTQKIMLEKGLITIKGEK